MPYSQVTYRNGYLFGYLEERVPDTVDLLASEMPDYLVATRYVKENDMEKKWKKIKEKESVRLDGITDVYKRQDPDDGTDTQITEPPATQVPATQVPATAEPAATEPPADPAADPEAEGVE